MWADDASKIDMLAYQPYADLITEIAVSERMNPLTIGLFGNWGSGKSTLLNLIEEQTTTYNDKNIAVVKVNAWIFEGYEDAKSALIEAILQGMKENKTYFEDSLDKIKSLIEKINWLAVGKKILKHGVPWVISGMTGLPSLFMLPKSSEFESPEKMQKQIEKLEGFSEEFINNRPSESIVQNIREFRKDFSSLIKDSSVDNLIILIDDLDRCNPDRIIETLEAIKLFLSVPKTTFIIAMDENIISYSIKRKYPQLDNEDGIDVSTDYLEKIVQLPIKISELAEGDVKNYMLLLISEMFLNEGALKQLIEILKQKGIFIKGEIITGTEIIEIIQNEITVEGTKYKEGSTQEEFEQQIQIFNSIGSIVASSLKGNPRQTKRFLNTFYIRKRLAEIQKLDLNIAVLAKLMVLEYFNSDLFKELFKWQFEHDGKPPQLSYLEQKILDDENGENNTIKIEEITENPAAWFSDKMKRWFGTEPKLSGIDLSPYFYLARDSISDSRIFSTNLNQEERKYINQICNLEINIELRRKKIKQLLNMDEGARNEIFKGVLEKYHQDNAQLETLIEIYKIVPQYKSRIFDTFKKLDAKKISIDKIILFQQLDDESFQKLKQYYIEEKNVDPKLWNLGR